MVFARLRLAARNLQLAARRPTSPASHLAGPSRSLIARARAPAFARLRLAARRPTSPASHLAGPSRSLIARARAPAFARLRLAARRPTSPASHLAGPSRSLIARARAPAFARLRLAARRPTSSASHLAGPSRSLIARARAPAFARLRLAARRPTSSASLRSLASRQRDREVDDLLAQRVAVDAEQRRGADLVTVGARERGLDQRPLDALDHAVVDEALLAVELALRLAAHEVAERRRGARGLGPGHEREVLGH